MAEAVVDGTPMSRFFCHKCSVEIERLLPDYTCPRCASGFIEELEGGGNDSSSGMDYTRRVGPERDLLDMILGLPNSGTQGGNRVSTGGGGGGGGGGRRLEFRRNTSSDFNRSRQEEIAMPIENFIQDFILNLSGAGLGHPVSQDGQPPVLFLGNPGDYVWGRDGLDAIVTQLLNQMDGTGPPPLPRKQIDEIPTTTVTQSQVDSKLQCSVCWEDFKLSEPVRQLPCQHVYHAPCIVPWLELHGTCPICRQSLGDQNTAENNRNNVAPSLAAFFRAATGSNNSRTSSSSSSESDSSSHSSEF